MSTPGPWTKEKNDWGSGFYVIAGHKQVCGVNQRLAGITESEAEANARLIAAAPQLLAACEPVDAAAAMKTPFWEEDWNPDAHVEITLTIAECRAIRAAIAKANG